MISTLRVLYVGSVATGVIVRDSLLGRSKCRLYVASSTWDVCVLLSTGEIDVAILDSTLSSTQMRTLSAHVRDRWPAAQILLMARGEAGALCNTYDERISPGASLPTLLSSIERLAACARRARLHASEPTSQLPENSSSPDFFASIAEPHRRSRCSIY